MVKNLPNSAGNTGDAGSIPGSGRFPGGGNGNPLPVFLPGKSHGQRSLAGYIPWVATCLYLNCDIINKIIIIKGL